jgi:hypothetical protein
MGKVQENQMRLKSNETHQLMVHCDILIYLAKRIYHKEKDRLCLSVDTKAIDVYKMIIKLSAYIHVSSI